MSVFTDSHGGCRTIGSLFAVALLSLVVSKLLLLYRKYLLNEFRCKYQVFQPNRTNITTACILAIFIIVIVQSAKKRGKFSWVRVVVNANHTMVVWGKTMVTFWWSIYYW